MRVERSARGLAQSCMNFFCGQAATPTMIYARMTVLFLFFYHPWQPMRALHGTAVRTLASVARGCKLLHKRFVGCAPAKAKRDGAF